MTSGTHPPLAILSALAPRKAKSITKKKAASATTRHSGQLHRVRATTANSSVVMHMVPVTAMPYAAPSALDVLKPATMSSVPSINARLICGT